MARSPATLSGILGVDPDALLSALPIGVTIHQTLVAATPEELRDSFQLRSASGDPLPLERLPGRQVLR